jgi:hypothetical protein
MFFHLKSCDIPNSVVHLWQSMDSNQAFEKQLSPQLPQLEHNHHKSMAYDLCEDGNTFWGSTNGRNF